MTMNVSIFMALVLGMILGAVSFAFGFWQWFRGMLRTSERWRMFAESFLKLYTSTQEFPKCPLCESPTLSSSVPVSLSEIQMPELSDVGIMTTAFFGLLTAEQFKKLVSDGSIQLDDEQKVAFNNMVKVLGKDSESREGNSAE